MRILISFALLSFSFSVFSQKPTLTDRTSFGGVHASRSTMHKALQADVFTEYKRVNLPESAVYHYFESMTLPQVSFSYGLTKWMDVKVYWRYTREETANDYVMVLGKEWEDIGIQTTFNITKQKGWIPEIAGNFGFLFDNLDFFDKYTTTTGGLVWKYRWYNRLSLTGSFIYDYNDIRFGTLLTAVRIGYEPIQGLGVYAGARSGSTSDWEVNVNMHYYAGLYYRINRNLQVSAQYLNEGKYDRYIENQIHGINVTLNWQVRKQ